MLVSMFGANHNGKNINHPVKKLRANLNMSQRELARELGTSYLSISRWELGRQTPLLVYRIQMDILDPDGAAERDKEFSLCARR